MRLVLIGLLTFCTLLTGCSYLNSNSRPKGEQVRAALDKFIKQENPNASIESIGNVDMNAAGNYLVVQFDFKDFVYKDDAGAKQTLASGKGSAGYDRAGDGSWSLDSVTVGQPDSPRNFKPNLKLE